MNNTEIWELYQKGVNHHNSVDLYQSAQTNHNFYVGDQWAGAKVGDEELPVYNIIKPIGKYKISMIAQNRMSIVYLPLSSDKAEAMGNICDKLTAYAAAVWEKTKMDTLTWQVIKNAFITGDHYLYCFDDRKQTGAVLNRVPQLKMRSVNKTNVYFADEQNPDINSQEWIILSERLPVATVRKTALQNGISPEETQQITKDEDRGDQLGSYKDREVDSTEGKCTSLLYMRKTEEGIEFCRATKQVVYVPMQIIPGLNVYPIAGMRWEEAVGDSRGVSGVKQLLSNQLIINKTAARRAIAVKRFTFPTMAYDLNRVKNIDELDTVGGRIAIEGLSQNPIDHFMQYLNPPGLSNDAQNLQNEMITQTQDLEGAGDAATGQVDPTKASGEAIKAARDQAAVPLNEQIANYKQLVEDIALLWYKLWAAYSPYGMELATDSGTELLDADTLRELDVDIKIEVSPVDPYSKLSQEIALERLMTGGKITFAEYVEALDDTSSVPKAKLGVILERRAQQEAQMLAQMPAPQEMAGMEGMPYEMS